jgi:Flp pilus assembly protein TadD
MLRDMNRVHLILSVLLACVGGALAQSPDDLYLPIYNLIQEGDAAAERDEKAQALAKYTQARTALQKFQKGFPEWSTDVVKFRLNYLGSRIANLSTLTPPPPPSQAPQAEKPVPSEVEAQLGRVSDQVRQLQADRSLLEAKLKEALAATPAAIDPRELAKAEERIKDLQKENELLTASIEAAKGPSQPGDTDGVANAQKALEEVQGLLAAEREEAARLAQEKEALQNRLKTITADSAAAALRAENELLKKQVADLQGAAEPGASPADVDALQKQLAALQSDKEVLRLEKEALQSRLKTVEANAANPGADAALRAENENLKKQLAEARNTPSGAMTELRNARAELASLRADRNTWALEKSALEKQIAEFSKQPVSTKTPKASKADTKLVGNLEKERDQLRKELESANARLKARKGKATVSRLQDMEAEIASLRARLQVMESARVPFTPQELAVMASSAPALAEATNPSQQTSLPPAATTLIAEARREFSARNFERAEAKYEEAIRTAGKHAPALADLATIQMERGKLEDAERTIEEALGITPDNAYSLSVLGQIQFRRGRYDDALDSLSRAAVLDPKSAEVQNFLGVTFGQKGMRTQAETALRKALQLQPGFGQAHNNLAVIYAAQQPPLLELARWHYQKAIAGGLPQNPELEKMLQAGAPVSK